MSHKPVESDKRTRVDRMLDRVKNNPVIAVLLVFGIGLAALAGFTESIKKLMDVLPQTTPQRTANVTGAWMSVGPDPITTVKTILVFDLRSMVANWLEQSTMDINKRSSMGRLEETQSRLMWTKSGI